MTLIRSISGIRGTIGGVIGEGLSPFDLVKYTSAFAKYIIDITQKKNPVIVVGRDGRISGPVVRSVVVATLQMMGADVIDLGLSTTPTVEMNVTRFRADGGIILTASHNPTQWNALKLLNATGEFLNAKEGQTVLDIAARGDVVFADVADLGSLTEEPDGVEYHIQKVLALKMLNANAIANADLKIVVDGINSTGGFVITDLLHALGVKNVIVLNDIPDGNFAHNPEPIPENLSEICERVKTEHADLGIVVDPDVDRLALVCEDGSLFGEEYTLVACADYVLRKMKGNTVSNLSSSRALRDVTEAYEGKYFASAVGEVNVVAQMKAVDAIIGGEGNGGVILPELHYGRDSLVGVALFLSLLAESKISVSQLKKQYPAYHISKNKIQLNKTIDVDAVLNHIHHLYKDYDVSRIDGVKIDLPDGWIHLRKSNTEPIIRIYTEKKDIKASEQLAQDVISAIEQFVVSSSI